jgi:peroxiredoxin
LPIFSQLLRSLTRTAGGKAAGGRDAQSVGFPIFSRLRSLTARRAAEPPDTVARNRLGFPFFHTFGSLTAQDVEFFMNAVLITVRLFLAVVLCVAAAAKFFDHPGSREAMHEFGVPESLSGVLAWLLPLAEISIAAALLPAATVEWGALGALALLFAFTVGVGVNVIRGRRADCHCFGQLHSAPMSWNTVVRNLVLTALAAFLFLQRRQAVKSSLIAWAGDLTLAERVNLVIGSLALVLLSVIVFVLVQLLNQQKELIGKLGDLRSDSDDEELPITERDGLIFPTRGLPIGAPAPGFVLSGLERGQLSLDDLLENSKPLLIIFISPGCGPCAALLPDIEGWQQEHAALLRVAIISSGSHADNRAKFADYSIHSVMLQEKSDADKAYDVYWTPSAVLINPDRSIGSQLASGGDQIRLLLQHSVEENAHEPWLSSSVDDDDDQPALIRIGDLAPDVSLRDLDRNKVRLSDFRDKKVMLVFWRPDCSFCMAMIDDLKSVEIDPPKGAPEMVLISSGSVEANRSMGLRSTILIDQDSRVSELYGSEGTPSAVLIDEKGKVASLVEAGAPRVLALLGRAPATKQAPV